MTDYVQAIMPCGKLLSNETTLRILADASIGLLSLALDGNPVTRFLPFAFRAGAILLLADSSFSLPDSVTVNACFSLSGETPDPEISAHSVCVQAYGAIVKVAEDDSKQDAIALLCNKYAPAAPDDPGQSQLLKLSCEKIIGCFASI